MGLEPGRLHFGVSHGVNDSFRGALLDDKIFSLD